MPFVLAQGIMHVQPSCEPQADRPSWPSGLAPKDDSNCNSNDSKKLSPKFIRPFEVLQIINPNAGHLKLPPTLQIHPVFNVSAIKHVSSSLLVLLPLPHPPSRVIDDPPAFTIHHLLACHGVGYGVQYLGGLWSIGGLLGDPSWLILDFHQAHPEMPRPTFILIFMKHCFSV